MIFHMKPKPNGSHILRNTSKTDHKNHFSGMLKVTACCFVGGTLSFEHVKKTQPSQPTNQEEVSLQPQLG